MKQQCSTLWLRIQPYWAFLILPIINLYALSITDILQENISHLVNAMGHYEFGVLWSLSCAAYFGIYTYVWMKQLHLHNKKITLLLVISCFGMVVSVLIPYAPDTMPSLAKFHIDLSMLSTILYVIASFLILYKSYFHAPDTISFLVPYYVLVVGGCMMFFLLMGCVTTLLEVMFVLGMAAFLFLAQKKTAETVDC